MSFVNLRTFLTSLKWQTKKKKVFSFSLSVTKTQQMNVDPKYFTEKRFPAKSKNNIINWEKRKCSQGAALLQEDLSSYTFHCSFRSKVKAKQLGKKNEWLILSLTRPSGEKFQSEWKYCGGKNKKCIFYFSFSLCVFFPLPSFRAGLGRVFPSLSPGWLCWQLFPESRWLILHGGDATLTRLSASPTKSAQVKHTVQFASICISINCSLVQWEVLDLSLFSTNQD